MIKFIIKIGYTAVMLIEGLVIIKIILLLINANMTNGIASWINSMAEVFVSPFNGLVTNVLQINGVQISLLYPTVALIYAVVAFILGEVLKTFNRE